MRVLGGKYRLVRQIASGGMGTVWLAEHTQLGSHVAVKLMAPQLVDAPALRTRFEREARSAAQLKGPNVVTIHDFGVDGDTPYIVMEYLEGEDLAARLRKVGAMAPAFVLSILDGAARALERAHELGIVHRDLKPSNVFLAREGGSEIVKVLDFGVAKNPGGMLPHEGDVTSASDSLIGSPSYMSPEQIRNAKAVDHRADLWSMGVLAYRMLTKQLPFQGEGSGDLLVRVCTEPFPPVRTYQTNLPVALDGFFARALAKDPAGRFNSARELTNGLASALGLPVPTVVGALPQAKAPPVPRRSSPQAHAPFPPALPSQQGYGSLPPALPPPPPSQAAFQQTPPSPHDVRGAFHAVSPPTPVPTEGDPSTLSQAGSVATSPGRTRQASLASLAVVVVSGLCVAMVAAFFFLRSEDPDAKAVGPRSPAAASPPQEEESEPAAEPEAEALPSAEPSASASAAAVPSADAPPAPSASGVLLDLDALPDGTAKPPLAGQASPPKGGGRPPPAASSAPAAPPRLELGL